MENEMIDKTKSSETSFWKSLFSFKGRNRRSEYWLTNIFANFLAVPSNIMSESDNASLLIIALLLCIPIVIIHVANVVKRCHDLGQSGVFGLILIIPFVNVIYCVYLAFFKGELNDNQYGLSPYKNDK